MRHGVFAAALSVVCLAAAPAAAQPLLTHEGDAYTLRATRISAPLRIDGRLDESVYEQVPAITEYIQQDPDEGAPISERTEAWVLFDDDNIYFACRCWDTHPERIVANDMRRDSSNLRQNDNFGVVLDTFHDRRNGFLFYVTPVGGMFDGATSDERINNADWNTVWQAKTSRFDGGWIAEIAIPFKSLRYGPGREQVWGINIRRTIRAKNEYAYITPLKRSWGIIALFRTSAAATLVGLEVPPPAMNLEIKPYAISRLTTDLVATPAQHNDFDPDVGLDVKYGVTKGLTADFTYNTDFAQVEADEVQVNLTRFNLLFPEKRDFFLEGQGLFTFGGVGGGSPPLPGTNSAGNGASDAPTIFYSRRIGLENGRAVPIIGGGRLSGRAGQWTIGALNISSDDDPDARAAQTNFTVLRVRRDVLRRSAIGALFTARSVSAVAPGSNELAGVDGNFSFFQNVYFNGYVGEVEDGRAARATISATAASSTTRPTATASNSIAWWCRRTSTPRSASCRGRTSGATSSPAALQPAAGQQQDDSQVLLRQQLQLHHRQRQPPRVAAGDGRVPRSSCRTATRSTSSTLREYEFLRRPFQVADTVRIPIGGYDFRPRARGLQPGAAASALGHGGVRRRRVLRRHEEDRGAAGASRRHVAARHRAEHVAELDRPRVGERPRDGRRRPHHLHDDAADVRRRAGPVRLEHVVAVDQPAVPVGVPAGERGVRRLHRGARHAAAGREHRPRKPRVRRQGEPAAAVLIRAAWLACGVTGETGVQEIRRSRGLSR